jgi:small membrane protein
MRLLPSQAILLAAFLFFGLYALRVRSIRSDRIILLTLMLAGVVLVLDPGLSTWVANRIGIGRGTDLVMYLFILFSLFRFVGISAETKRTQRQVTLLARELAILTARSGNEPDAQRPASRSHSA